MQTTETAGPAAIARFRNDIFPLLQDGVAARNSGDTQLAESLLKSAGIFDPGHWQPFYELFVMYEDAGKRDEGISMLWTALRNRPGCGFIIERLASLLTVSGRTEEALNVISSCDPEDDEAISQRDASRDFIQYVKQFNISLACEMWQDAVTARGGMLPVHAVTDRILSAIHNAKPFAMVRLGDGEGTWLHQHTEERRFGALYHRNRLNFWNTWYGAEAAPHISSFIGTADRIKRKLKHADIIGMPPLSWIKHEYNIGSLRGYPGTLNALRVADIFSTTSTEFTTQLMHIEMENNNVLPKIVKAAKKVAIVSCHPQIAEFFSTTFDIDKPEVVLIPGEPSRRHLHGEMVTTGIHFPNRYIELSKQISEKDYSGYLCLVAGGILGKSYALDMKRAGAVAVDIGSIADKLLGKKTRPIY